MLSTASAPLDHELFAGLRAGDERALERLVRSRYPELLDEARRELAADAAAAPHVVELAALRIWESREQLDGPAAVERVLHSAIHMSALRERSRIATRHRIEAHQGVRAGPAAAPGTDNPDIVWSHIAAAIHHAPSDPAAHAEQLRHGTAAHVARVTKPRPWGWTAAITAAVTVAVMGALWSINNASGDVAATRALAASNARNVTTGAGQQGNVALLDQSVAAMQPDSKLTIPAEFGGRIRTVALEGAATFTVPTGSQPFAVRTPRGATVSTTGGELGVRAYREDHSAAVAVRRGSASVVSAAGRQTLAAGQSAIIDGQGAISTPSADAREQMLGWMDGRFASLNQPLRATLPALRRWYNLELDAQPATLLDRTVSIRAPLNSTRAVLAALDSGAGLRYEWQGRRMVLHDARADAARPAPAP